MTETQQRFLRAIAERVPADQVVELHLFPPIRQGGVETGVAVVAEDPRRAVPNADDGVANEPADPGADAMSAAGAREIETVEPATMIDADPEPVAVIADEQDAGDMVASNGAEPDASAPAVARLIIHTARYRLTLKGIDRGKWEVDVVAEADAPLDAVDAVIRGVQRRAGEGAEPDRLSTDAFREALDAPLASLER